MRFVIWRTDQGQGWLARNIGVRGSSYTHRLQDAQVFATREEAEKARCPENETVQSLMDIFGERA